MIYSLYLLMSCLYVSGGERGRGAGAPLAVPGLLPAGLHAQESGPAQDHHQDHQGLRGLRPVHVGQLRIFF